MPFIPTRVQQGNVGPQNPAGGARVSPPTVIKTSPPAQGQEQFSGSTELQPTTLRALQSIQNQSANAMQQSASRTDANNNVLEGCSFKNGVTLVLNHGLGKSFRGFHIDTPQSYARFKLVPQNSAALDKRTISIVADADCVCNVTVFA